MKMDRDLNMKGKGKYALVKLREFDGEDAPLPEEVARRIEMDGERVLDYGWKGGESEFMVIRLKDRYAQAALRAYADAVRPTDPEYAAAVDEMAARAGPDSPWCKEPD